MSIVMTRAEREAFLAGPHVGVLGVTAPGRAPVVVPVWYIYEPGGLVSFSTGKNARKVELLRAAERLTLCVLTEKPPYRYVSVEGPVVAIDPCDVARDLLPLAERYLGPEGGKRYVADVGTGENSVIVRMRPERWSSADYGKE